MKTQKHASSRRWPAIIAVVMAIVMLLPATALAASSTIEIHNVSGGGVLSQATITGVITNADGSTATFDITNSRGSWISGPLQSGTFQETGYSVELTVTWDDGVTATYTMDVEHMSTTGNGVIKFKARQSVTIEKPPQPILGSMTILKERGPGVDSGVFTFKVTGPGGFEETYEIDTRVRDSIVIDGLPLGNYRVEEDIPDGAYKATYNPPDGIVNVVNGQTPVVKVTNNPLYDLTIIKNIEGNVPDGVYTFVITGDDGFEERVTIPTVGKTGSATVEVPAGGYAVTETGGPDYSEYGFTMITRYYPEDGLTEVGDGGAVVTVTNRYIPGGSSLTVIKDLDENGENGRFRFRIDGVGFDFERIFSIRTEDFHGEITLDDLPDGEYVITEVGSGSGRFPYDVSYTDSRFIINREFDTDVRITVTNTLKSHDRPDRACLTIHKTLGTYGVNGRFHFVVESVSYEGFRRDVYITTVSGEGFAVIPNLPYGQYKVTEVSGAGYAPVYTPADGNVRVGENGGVVTVVNNSAEPRASLTINKVLGTYTVNGTYHFVVESVSYAGFRRDVYITTVGGAGFAVITDLPYGQYKVTEISGAGYTPYYLTENGIVRVGQTDGAITVINNRTDYQDYPDYPYNNVPNGGGYTPTYPEPLIPPVTPNIPVGSVTTPDTPAIPDNVPNVYIPDQPAVITPEETIKPEETPMGGGADENVPETPPVAPTPKPNPKTGEIPGQRSRPYGLLIFALGAAAIFVWLLRRQRRAAKYQ